MNPKTKTKAKSKQISNHILFCSRKISFSKNKFKHIESKSKPSMASKTKNITRNFMITGIVNLENASKLRKLTDSSNLPSTSKLCRDSLLNWWKVFKHRLNHLCKTKVIFTSNNFKPKSNHWKSSFKKKAIKNKCFYTKWRSSKRWWSKKINKFILSDKI